ncbi:TolC family protein [Synechococcus sp. UW140]|uniref:TolC family protein n=1 Tax=Synechococcus sp. UW140 TaxID=368503 RepID=UPI000E0E1037|nr:TolC family protein [Synechococcus sp. UW140]
MLRRRFLVSLLLAAVAALPARAEPLALSLEQALERGMEASLALKQTDAHKAGTAADVGISRSLFLPKLDVVGLGSWAQVGSSIGFISNLPTIGDLNVNLRGDGYAVIQNSFGNIGLALSYPLINFERGPLLAAAQALDQAADVRVQEQRRQSRFAITNAYLNLQLTEALIPVWQRSIALSTTLLKDAEALLDGGLGARIDVFRAQALLASDQSGLSAARSEQAIAASALARLLDLPAEQTLEASAPLLAAAPWPLDLQASVEAATSNRPALDVIRQERAAAEAKVRAARGTMLPRVGLLVGGGINGDNLSLPVLNGSNSIGNVPVAGEVSLPGVSSSGSASGSFYDYGVLLTLRQPLFDGGLSAQSAALAESQVQEQRLLLKQREQVIILAVESFWHTHRSAAETMQASRKAVVASEEAVRDAQLRYRAGIAPVTELLLAQRDLQAARSAEATAIQQWNLSRAGLELETGQR